MKSITLFCTKMRFFLVEIPIIYLLTVAIINNNLSGLLLKLYPLIAFCMGAIIFIAVYFFRAIRISFSEIRDIGRFSDREVAVINAGKTLILKMKNRSTVNVELFGNNGQPPLYSMENADFVPMDINLFRGRIIGGERSIKKILKFFGTSAAEAQELIASECSFEYENVNISSHNTEEGSEIRIFMKNTI